MIRREDSLRYHENDRPGKIELRATKPCLTPRDMRLAYLPGAVFPSESIATDPQAAFRFTARGNLVGVVTNGSAVPGVGDVGPLAAKPMQEGVAVLFKRLADIEVFDLEIDARDPEAFVDTISRLEPTFGGINLKDIRAPEGLQIYDRLSDTLCIPVFHENLHSTAVVAAAALLNALDLVDKAIDDVQVVICGAGTVGLGCARLLRKLGVSSDCLCLYDVDGLICQSRETLDLYQREFAVTEGPATLAEGLRGADVFVGASAGGVLTQDMVRSMGRFPVVLALATPIPEITYAEARAARRDVIVATSQGQDPNAIVDLLSFPYIFRGALDCHATRITENMLIAAARALAELAREDVVDEVVRAYGNERFTFGPEYLLPKPIDPRIFVRESAAVARQAMDDGVARKPLDLDAYEERLTVRLGAGQETLRRLILKARQETRRVVFPEGANETILRACSILADEGIADPILLGVEKEIHAAIERLGLELGGVRIIDPARSPQREAYVNEFFALRQRHGVTSAMAVRRLRDPEYFAAMMLHHGDADLMMTGLEAHYADSLHVILDAIGTSSGIKRMSGHYMVLLPKAVYFLADCAVNIDPSAEDLAETALLAARLVRSLSIDPRLAMLSFSNFGSVNHPLTRTVRKATQLVKERNPALVCDGEMQLTAAVNSTMRKRYYPFSDLHEDANVLVFPDLQSGYLALDLLQELGDAVIVGPVLMGGRLPAHILPQGSSVEHVVNLTAISVVAATAEKSP
jgi:malate dehydrogenase (oxaloacetate-decarboxylating)(NADP+)